MAAKRRRAFGQEGIHTFFEILCVSSFQKRIALSVQMVFQGGGGGPGEASGGRRRLLRRSLRPRTVMVLKILVRYES